MLNELTKIGMSEKEAKVYVAALELGKATIQDISKKAGLNRTTVYVLIVSLEKMGLIKTIKIGKKNYFVGESPDVALNLLSKEKAEIEKKEADFRKILPELKSLYNVAPGRPKIRFYEGPESNRKINDDILESGAEEILEIHNADFVRKTISEEDSKYIYKKRVEKGIKYRALYTRKDGPFRNRQELAEERFIDSGLFPVEGDVFIYADRIGLSSVTGNNIGVIIESKEISMTMRSLFELAWKSTEMAPLKEESDDELEGGE